MNEKIKELAEQSGVVEPHVDWEAAGGVLLEKFAELIIRECIGICDVVQENYGKYTFTATTVKIKIKQHFGIE